MRRWRVFLLYLFVLVFFLAICHVVAIASTSPWSQSDWSGGSGQSVWLDSTKYSSSASISATTAQITIASRSGWLDTSWKYRQSVAVTNNSGSSLTDYQIPIYLNTQSLISGSKMQSDCRDLRVTDSGGNSLSYWIATSPSSNTCNQTSTKIWVKAQTLSTSGETFYIYYGNSSATSQSNGSNVFVQFADFTNSGSSLPSNFVQKDIGTSGSVTVNSDGLTIYNTNGVDVWDTEYGATHVYNNMATVSGSFVAEALITNQYNSNEWAKAGITVQNSVSSGAGNGQAFVITTPNNGVQFQWQSSSSTESCGSSCIAANVNYPSPSVTGSITLPYFLRLTKNSSNQVSAYYSTNGSSWTKQGSTLSPYNVSANQYVTLFATPHSASSQGYATFPFFYVRKFATDTTANLPSAGTPATEQSSYASSSATLTSSIFDTEQSSNFGTLTYSATAPSSTSATVKVRTSNNSNMSGAVDFFSCAAINSGSDITSNSCVSDGNRYVQYQVTLTSDNGTSIPSLQNISIEFSVAPTTSISTSTSNSSSTSVSSPSCSKTAPSGVPNLYQLDSSQNEVTLYFTPVAGSDSYYVRYGAESSANQYATNFAYSDMSGAVKYKIGSLQSNTKYYFTVRAGNGCAAGAWSNIVSAKTKSSSDSYSNENIVEKIVGTIQNVVAKSKKIKIISSNLTENKSNVCNYVVKSGDSLWTIASEKLDDGTKSLDIRNLNNLSGNQLKVGQELKLPCDNKAETIARAKSEIKQVDLVLDVKVLGEDKRPVVGATVTLHSKIQTAKTGKDGIAHFENVEKGEHKVSLAYNGYKGEQKLTLDGSKKQETLTVEVKLTGFSLPFVITVIVVMGLIIVAAIIVIIFLFQKNKKSSSVNKK